jgi:hypothetical protein
LRRQRADMPAVKSIHLGHAEAVLRHQQTLYFILWPAPALS